MPYVSLDNLARFHGRMRDWASSEFASLDMANWQKTAAAGAVSFSPVPEMPLDPVVNFLFSESGPASGTKGPDNPSTISGVTQVKATRCGKNLIWEPWADAETVTKVGITWTVNGDGTVTASGTATSDSYFNIRPNRERYKQKIHSGVSYVLSGCPSGGSNSTFLISLVCKSATFKDFGSSVAVSVGADDSGWLVCCVRAGVTVSNLVFRPQLELGSAATAFEPYSGAEYTVNLGGTYYGGSVDLSTGVMTVTKEFVTLDTISVSDGIANGNAVFRAWPESLGILKPINDGTEICEELPRAVSGTGVNRFFVGTPVNGNCPIHVVLNPSLLDFSEAADPSNPTATEVRNAGIAYLNEHPLHMVLSLETPYTVQLTPMQIYSLSQPDPYNPRTNTVYSDQTSVQVGYPKSPQATQNELTNAVVSLGGNV